MATSIGSVTGQVRAVGQRGKITYAESAAGGSVYSGDSGTNTLITTLAAGGQFSPSECAEFDGLYITGNVVIHLG